MLPRDSTRRRILSVGVAGLMLLAGLWVGWAMIGGAGWGYLCTGREIDFGGPNGCVTTVFPDLQYGDGQNLLGLDLLLHWIEVAPPVGAGIAAIALATLLRSRHVLAAGLTVALALFVASAALWHLTAGAFWEPFWTEPSQPR